MIEACFKAMLFPILLFICLFVSSSVQSFLRPDSVPNAIIAQDQLSTIISPYIGNHTLHHIRVRKQIETEQLNIDENDVWMLQGFENRRGCPDAVHQFKVFQNIDQWYAVIAKNSTENNTEIYQFSAESGCGKLLVTIPTQQAFDFEIVRANKLVHVVILEKNPLIYPYKKAGTSIYTIIFGSTSNITISRREVIQSEEPTCITSWEQFGVPHIAICIGKTKDLNGVETYRTQSLIYRATGDYFDQQETNKIATHNPRTIQHFTIFSKHYLAVANHPNETKGEDVATEILRFNVATDRYEHLQFLPTKGAKDICFLQLGFGLKTDHFLIVVNQLAPRNSSEGSANTHVYKFMAEKWEPFQLISHSSNMVSKCLAYQTNNGKSALLFATSWGLDVYQYNGWRFVPTMEYSQFALGPGINRLGLVHIHPNTFLTVANSNPAQSDGDNLFLLNFSISPDATLATARAKDIALCHQLRSELEVDPAKLIVDLYPLAVKKNDSVIRLGKVDFNQVSVANVWTNQVANKWNNSRLGAKQLLQLHNMFSNMDRLSIRLRDIAERIKLAVRTNGNYLLAGKVQIGSVVSTCQGNGCTFEIATADTVNGVDMASLYRHAALQGDSNVWDLKIKRLAVKQNIFTRYLSDHHIKEYVDIGEENILQGNIKVVGNLMIDQQLSVNGTVNGYAISPAALLLRTGNQTLNRTLKASDVHLKNINVHLINGENVSHLYRHAITNTANVTLTQPASFSSLTVGNLTLVGLVNQINLTDLQDHSMKLSGDQIVTGIHGYKTAHLGKMNLSGLINGKRFPQDFVSVRENDHLKIKRLQLDDDTSMAKLSVTENFAGMTVKEGRFGSNLVNRSTNQLQVVNGQKRLSHVTSNNDVFSQTINSQPMDQFNNQTSLYGHPDELLVYESVDVEGTVTFEKPLSVAYSESVGLQLLEEKAVPLNADIFPPVGSLTFTSNVQIDKDLSVSTLDGVPSSDFVTRDIKTIMILTGRKTFSRLVTMNHTFTLLYHLNGYELRSLWNATLRIEGNQTIPGSLFIKNDVDVVKIQTQNSHFVPLGVPSMLSGKKRFKDLSIKGRWFVDVLDVGGLFHDVDVNSWPSDTVLKNGSHLNSQEKNQQITSQKSIRSMTVKNAEILAIDDIDIQRLQDVVLMDHQMSVFSNLTIIGPVFSDRLLVSGSIDQVASDAPLHWLRYNVDQQLSGEINIQGNLTVADFFQDSWMVNGVNLRELLYQVVLVNESRTLSTLQLNHVVVDNLGLGGLIQGYNVTEDLVLKQSDQSLRFISGVKSFSGPIVSESLRVDNTLNNVEPTQVCDIPIPDQTSNWIVFGNVILKKSAKLNASVVNNRNLTDITRQLWLKEDNVTVIHQQIFQRVILKGDQPEVMLNNLSLSELSRRSIKLSSLDPQLITSSHQFQTLAVGSLLVDSLDSSSINGVDLTLITDSVLLRDVEQIISNSLLFQNIEVSNVSVAGSVNGINVDVSMLRNDLSMPITATKSVDSLVVTGTVETCSSCRVGSVDVSNWAAKSVLRTGNFTLSGAQFESMNVQKPLILNGSLNNVTLGIDHVLTLTGQQEVNGRLSVSSLLPENISYSSDKGAVYQQVTDEFSLAARFKNLQVNRLYDGVSLPRFYDQMVRRDTEMVFSRPVSVSNLNVHTLGDFSINSTIRDILELPLNVTHSIATSPIVSDMILPGNTSMSTLLQKISRVVSHQPMELQFFEEMPPPEDLPSSLESIFILETGGGQFQLCGYDSNRAQFFCNSMASPLLKDIEVRQVSSMRTTDDFAVATLDRSKHQKNNSFIFSRQSDSQLVKQSIATVNPIDSAAFLVGNKSCFLFLEKSSKSPIYCRPLDSNGGYLFTQSLPTVNAQLVSIAHNSSSRTPFLIISSLGQRGYGDITVWHFNQTKGLFEPWKAIATLHISAMDSFCTEALCLLATVAPSKPAAIPAQVIIWSLNEHGPPKRLQRIGLTEPADVKFARLPDGRISLMVLETGGIDNVLVYIWRGLLQFQHKTTVRVPGAKNLQLISSKSHLILALTIASPASKGPYGPLRMFRARFLGRLT